MEKSETCILCGESARREETDGGKRHITYCTGSCPTYEIPLRAEKELEGKPTRKENVIQQIKAFHKENPNDMPVIRMDSFHLTVTTLNRERKKRKEEQNGCFFGV